MIYLLYVNYTIVRLLRVSQMLIGMFEHVGEYLILAASCIYTKKKKVELIPQSFIFST